jgi:hypothetical protein
MDAVTPWCEGFKAHDVEYRLLLFDVIDLIGVLSRTEEKENTGAQLYFVRVSSFALQQRRRPPQQSGLITSLFEKLAARGLLYYESGGSRTRGTVRTV